MINNRQAGRRRGRGGNGQGQGGQGGGNGPRQNGGQRDSGNRIDSRARGNANQLYEKYKNLASDAQRQGDRVNTEYYLQFADHYFRVLSETRNRFDEQNQQRRQQNDGYEAQAFVGSFDTGFDNQDDEFGDEGEPIRANEQRLGEQAFVQERGGDDRPDRDGNQRNDRDGNQRENVQRVGRQNGAANGQSAQTAQREGGERQNGGQNGGQNGDRPRRDGRSQRDGAREDGDRNGQAGPRDAQPRYEGQRNDAARNDMARNDVAREDGEPSRAPRAMRRNREEGLDAAPVNGQTLPVPETSVASEVPAIEASAEAEAPRRRGRPRRERPVDDAPASFDAALLPPSLGIAPAAPAVEAAADGEDKPRRRRVRAAVEVPPVAG